MMDHLWLAFGLTLLAGLATGLGSVIAFFAPRANYRFLAVATGFSAGVMLYVSFVEIWHKAGDTFTEVHGEAMGKWLTAASFFAGIAVIFFIDQLIPKAENPHEIRSVVDIDHLHDQASQSEPTPNHDHNLLRMGLFTALAIAIHNFPEGMATFLVALKDPTMGIAIAVAIALHNIPEGISVSVPIYYATGNRRKAFVYSFLSGLAEPVGAMIGYLILRPFMTDTVMAWLFGGIAGVMVYISLDELLPTSRAYGKGHDTLLGLMAGMIIMALSLLLTALPCGC
jgi:ZIP family zinc transporter